MSLSGRPTVLGRRVSLRVWSRTQIALALRDCIVLISVNTVLRLLKTEEVDVRQGQNALGSLLLSTGLSAIVARNYKSRSECEIQITASQLVSSLVSCIQAQNLV